MAHIDGDAARRLVEACSCPAPDETPVALLFDKGKPATTLTTNDGDPLTLGDLRMLADAFARWL